MVELENENIKVRISSKGAELQSVFAKDRDVEYLWQGNVKYWGRRAPVLFPIVGGLKDGKYKYNGKTYTMSQHGFARDEVFELVKADKTQASFRLVDNERTRSNYPFQFSLLISYELVDQQLRIAYQVQNTGKNTLLYSIGGHPAFNCPLLKEEQRSDYQLIFNHKETAHSQFLENGVRAKEGMVLNNSSRLPISDDLFDEDALIFSGLKSSQVTLSGPNGPVLDFDFSEFDYLGIWSKNSEAPFVCIEPWMGVADHALHNGDFDQKEGVRSLESNGMEEFLFSTRFF
ncbi:MAG: aldose 1-epimerase family protein [Cyclobacteriaceae bacterium]